MKTGLFSITALALLQVALAQPHGRAVRHQHHRRQAVVTEVDVVTVEAAEVIVYVDEHNVPVATTVVYNNVPAPPTNAPAPVNTPNTPASSPPSSPAPASTTPAAAAPSPPPAPQPTTLVPSYGPPPKPSDTPKQPDFPKPSDSPKESPPPAPPAPPKSSPAPAPSPSSSPEPSNPPSAPSQGPGFSNGISYSPYNADNTCKSASQVSQDLSKVTGYQVLRLYGTDCSQVSNVLAATKGQPIQLFAGIFDIDKVATETQTLIDAVHGDWSRINTVSVGNELVNNGKASVDQVTAAIAQARQLLKAAGYNGPVVTVDTMVAMKNNIGLCTASDYCAINCHAFFDGKVAAPDAGKFVLGWVQQIADAAKKPVVVTESGWPSAGDANGKAVPSVRNQQVAVESLKGTFKDNLILYSAFNNLWMKDSGATFGAERFWGVMGNAPSS